MDANRNGNKIDRFRHYGFSVTVILAMKILQEHRWKLGNQVFSGMTEIEVFSDTKIACLCGIAQIKSIFCMIKSDRKRFSGLTQDVLLLCFA